MGNVQQIQMRKHLSKSHEQSRPDTRMLLYDIISKNAV